MLPTMPCHKLFAAAFVVFVIAASGVESSSRRRGEGSCAAAKKCCDGQDTDCAVTHDVNFLSSQPCYCDQGCLDMGDCCSDFKSYCGVIDCKLSEWSEWSTCSVACGKGEAKRTRTITHPPANGGAECGDQEQSRVCRTEHGCNNIIMQDTVSALRETAMLLPGKWSSKRTIKDWDVRQNLKTYVEPVKKDEYCVVFRVHKAMKACVLSEDTQQLHRGNEICVSCESKAVREKLGDRCTGHGVAAKQTRFKNVITPACHGRWERLRVEADCSCANGPNFIFV